LIFPISASTLTVAGNIANFILARLEVAFFKRNMPRFYAALVAAAFEEIRPMASLTQPLVLSLLN
jgi:hypothetical protein